LEKLVRIEHKGPGVHPLMAGPIVWQYCTLHEAQEKLSVQDLIDLNLLIEDVKKANAND